MNLFSNKSMNLPNILTLARIGAVPVIMLLLFFGEGGRVTSFISAIIFLVASLTDLLDGYLARKYKLVTNLGKFLDPLADKLLNAAALIMLIPLDRVPAWLVFLIIGREIAITGLRGIGATEGVVISASMAGKQKTLTQNIAIFCLLWHYKFLWVNAQPVGIVLLYLALYLTYRSGMKYFTEFFRILNSDSGEKVEKDEKGA